MTTFSDLHLSQPLNVALEKLGYTTPTPIQQQAIPVVLAGRDIMGIAQTGTGKTAAFALPTLDHIIREERDPPKRGARVLVLAPTRELAAQIAVSFRDYGRDIPHLAVTCVYGGVKIAKQIKRVVGGNDILVATPGRLIDLLDRKDVRLSEVEVLILDEADQMMDMGFIHALRKIVPLLPKKRQTLFFSATVSPQIKKLAGQFLNDPVSISVSPANSTADKVTQSVIFVKSSDKPDLLALILSGPDVERALIFTRTKHGADRAAKRMTAMGLPAVAIHGNKSQPQRQKALAAFRAGEIKFMVATDVAARGIDIEGISHVINYEVPNVPEQYVHRIGRTARANTSGKAIAFVAEDERAYLKDIQKLLKITIPVDPMPDGYIKKAQALRDRPKSKEDIPEIARPKPRPKRVKKKKPPKTAEELMLDGEDKPRSGRPNRHRPQSGRPGNSKPGDPRPPKQGGGQRGGGHQGGGPRGGNQQGGPKSEGGSKGGKRRHPPRRQGKPGGGAPKS